MTLQLSLLVAILFTVLAPPVSAAEEHDHDHDHEQEQDGSIAAKSVSDKYCPLAPLTP